jgi:ribosomal protein S11
MLLLQTILKNTYIFLKKKYIIIYFIMWLKILKRNYSLIKIINVIKFNNYIVDVLAKINKQCNLFLYNYQKNPEKKFKLNNVNIKNYNLISYIIKITLLKSNIYINVTNIKGKILIACSSGKIKLKGSQKTKRLAYNRIIKFTKFKIRKLKNKIFAIHFMGIKSNRKKLLKSFKKYFYIKSIKYYNLIAHNGCRLKK